MSKWRKVKLKNIAMRKLEYGSGASAIEYDGQIRYIRITDINESGRLNNDPVSPSTVDEKYKLKEGDILFARSGATVGKTFLYHKENGPCIYAGYLIRLVPNEKVANSKYVYYYTKTPIYQAFIESNKRVVAQPNINAQQYGELEIPLPPLDIQRIIAQKMNTATELLAMRKQQLAELNNLIKSTFYDMFGDPVTNEKRWEMKQLSRCCYINPKKSEIDNFTDNFQVSFIAMPSVSINGDIDTTEIRDYIDVKKGFTYFYENDVLFAKITPCMENGKGAIARNLKNNIGFGSTEFHVLRPIEGVSNSEWLYRLTVLSVFRENAENNMSGSAGQKRVPTSFFDKFIISLPPFPLQNQFAEIVTKIEEQKALVKKAIDETQYLFDSLMSDYFE